VLWLAVELWEKGGQHGDGDTAVTIGGVFVTTLLNPKAIVFAFTLLPLAPAHELGPRLAALAALILVAGSAWIVLGAAIRHGTGMSPQASYRAGAWGFWFWQQPPAAALPVSFRPVFGSVRQVLDHPLGDVLAGHTNDPHSRQDGEHDRNHHVATTALLFHECLLLLCGRIRTLREPQLNLKLSSALVNSDCNSSCSCRWTI
jgi:hypothetical protein